MSSTVEPQPELPAAEELVAYLDGELPPADCRRVEERLASDADYRRQLRDLDQAWEALDSLPTARADDDFARTTMELVTVAAEGDASSIIATATAAKRSRMRRWAAIGIAGAAVGFVAAWALLPHRNRALINDLPVIIQADTLPYVANVEFLRRLSKEVPLDQFIHDEALLEEDSLHLQWAGAEAHESRREWIEALSPEQKASLSAQANRFDGQRREEQERLRNLEREISKSPDADRLQRTLIAYGQWLSRLTAGEQEQLREDLSSLPIDEQVGRVLQSVRKENAQALRRLSSEEAEALRKEVLAIARERQSTLQRELRGRGDGDRLRRLEGPRGAIIILSRELQNDRDGQTAKRLVSKLSPESQAYLERIGNWRRRLQLWQWISESMQSKFGPDELERFFAEKLDNNQRERLLNLPPAEMQAQLERLYFGAELGFGDSEQWWKEFRESGGGPWNAPGRGPGVRPDGPPRGRDRPGGPPPEFRDRGRPPGPDGPPRPREDGRRPPNRPEDRQSI